MSDRQKAATPLVLAHQVLNRPRSIVQLHPLVVHLMAIHLTGTLTRGISTCILRTISSRSIVQLQPMVVRLMAIHLMGTLMMGMVTCIYRANMAVHIMAIHLMGTRTRGGIAMNSQA